MTLPQILKSGTQAEHASLEKQLVTQMKAVRDTGDYLSLLRLFYGFYRPVETAMEQWLVNLPDGPERRKSASLLADIEALGGNTDAIALCPVVPAIHSAAEALGAAYVLEGSTLGGTIIAGMMKKQLKKNDDTGLSFFNGYGEETRHMWSKFSGYLATIEDPHEQQQILAAARETFLSFKKWGDSHE